MALALGNSDISNELWNSALPALELKFSKPIFEMWIKPMRLVALSGNEMVLSVQSNFARDWVENRLKSEIRDVLRELFAAELNLQFTVAPETPPAATRELQTPENLPPAKPIDEWRPGNLNTRYTF